MTGVVQSYGGGVQSRAMLHMALDGALPRPDRIVFADTMAEPEDVYRVVNEDRQHANDNGIPFDIVTHGDLSATDKWGGVTIPAHTYDPATKSKGMLRRQCTGKFKVTPIRRHLRALGYTSATLTLGITVDEAGRMKDSNVKWLTHAYPLVDLGLSRDDCAAYLDERGLTTAKSACVFCPYRSAYGWARMRANPRDWAAAVAYDRDLRHKRPAGGELFVHPDRVPLEEAGVLVFSRMRSLFDGDDQFGNECEGHCGV